ncbi:MAG TPA: hypothetical protein PKI19_03425 [Elusimicrobiales bacterium]|mgnify:CR=1 FL=1|nr:hypothetical protein [Elusimicrobiales bacterium]
MNLKKELPRGSLPALAGGLLALLWLAGSGLGAKLAQVRADAARLEAAVPGSAAALEELRVLRDLKLNDAANYKTALKELARSKRAVYDTGASLQEEKRLLEKQLEIMTTYLEIKEETGKISLMRGDHSLNDYPFSYAPLKIFGADAGAMPGTARIISKERYAQPQRGKVEEVNGKISWEPPQTGTDPRSGALGQFVLFTDGPLILHGPAPKKALHDAFPHACAGVTAYTAQKLFDNTFIGTKILYTRKKKTQP